MPSHTSHPSYAALFSREFWIQQSAPHILWNVAKIVILYVVLRFLPARGSIARVVTSALAEGEKRVDAQRAARLKTLAGLINSVVSYTLTFVFGVMILRAIHLDPVPLLTTASVAGLAVGFGAQKLVKDVISGFFILLENQYAVGDYVTVNSVTGTVEEVGMRTTQIRDEAGRLYILSNGDVSLVCNQSRGAVAAFVEIGIAASADVHKATEVINAAGSGAGEEQARSRIRTAPGGAGAGRDGRCETDPACRLPRDRARQTY